MYQEQNIQAVAIKEWSAVTEREIDAQLDNLELTSLRISRVEVQIDALEYVVVASAEEIHLLRAKLAATEAKLQQRVNADDGQLSNWKW